MEKKFKVGQVVCNKLNPSIQGFVIGILERKNDYIYNIDWLTTEGWYYDFQLIEFVES